MTAFHVALGVALIAVNAAAGLWGAWCWWRHRQGRGFWPLLRVGQGLVMLQAVDGALLLLIGRDLPELHLIYGLVPLGVSFVAEQLRLVTAETVMAQRGLEGTGRRGGASAGRAARAGAGDPAPRDGRDGRFRTCRGRSRGKSFGLAVTSAMARADCH